MQPLKPYRRHLKNTVKGFTRAAKPTRCGITDPNILTKCNCPLWAYGVPASTPNAKPIRVSLATNDIRRANAKIEAMDALSAAEARIYTFAWARTQYEEDCKGRLVKKSTRVSYANTLDALEEYLKLQNIEQLDQITVETLRGYRAHRLQFLENYHAQRNAKRPAYLVKGRASMVDGQVKELGHLRAFFTFCVVSKWILESPAKQLRSPKKPDDEVAETEPFSAQEVTALIGACYRIDNNNRSGIDRAVSRAVAMVLTFLYSGLRISDIACLKRSLVTPEGNIVRTLKTGKRVYIKLPPVCISALRALPLESTEYFFWSGEGKSNLDTTIKSMRRTLSCLGRMTQIHVHPHRFRDTFAVNVLVAGHSMRTLQLLLGHKSIKTTEKHYAPFVPAMQKALDEATESLNFDLGPALVVHAD